MLFRVATYNVHKCKGMDWRVSPARIAEVISRLNVDVLAVQEIVESQAANISTRLEIPFVFGSARDHDGEPYGNAVFTRVPVTAHRNYDLTVGGREQRQCLHVSLTLAQDHSLEFFGVHLGTSFVERRHQARRLVSNAILGSDRYSSNRIVAGDFNEWTRGLATKLLGTHMRSADIAIHLKRGATYPGIAPFLHLDHIYYDPDFELREMQLYRTRLSLLASDHLPLIATFGV
jgi:endonuclease/exonuclease/phosphatase family metal-dependent hydrolase